MGQMVRCPECGNIFDAQQAQILTLSSATRAVWDAAGFRFRHGLELMGPTDLAKKCNRSISTVAYHLAMLRQAGLVEALPQNRHKRERHLYRGTMRHGVARAI